MNTDTTSTPTKQRNNHVFLFRHCVRSTDSKVYLFNHTTNSDSSSSSIDVAIPVTKFWSRLAQPEVILPQWNVPKFWCTEIGVQQMQQTGTYIYNNLLVSSTTTGRKLKFRFISDTSQRDIDTTFGLQEGIASAMLLDTNNANLYRKENDSTISLESTNIHSVEYIPNLFQPFINTTMSSTPTCTLQVTKEQMLDEVQNRMSNNIISKPPSNIYDTLKLLQIDGLNMMNVDTLNNVTVTSDSKDKVQLTGMINFLKLVAQLVFYSRASGIIPRQFLYRITTSQLYTILLPYIYYTRSILNIGTTESATRGAILTRTMMDAIEMKSKDDEENEDYDTVTILVGHDTDLDAVATAMNVAWEFDLPYNTNNVIDSNSFLSWYMTPPGSAIYIRHDDDNNDNNSEDTKVTMSYFHPIYNIDQNDGSITSYDMVPLKLLNYSSVNGKNEKLYQINNNSVTVTWRELQQHINSTLQQYTGATDCYYKPLPVSGREPSSESIPTIDPIDIVVKSPTTAPQITPSTSTTDEKILSKSWGNGFGTGIAVSIFLVLLLWLYNFRKQRRNMRHIFHPSTSLQLNQYSDASVSVDDDADTVTTNNRSQTKRNVDII